MAYYPGKDKAPPRQKTEMDLIQAGITSAVAKALVDVMRPMIADEPCKLVKSFQLVDVERLAVAAVTAYVTERRKRDVRYGLTVELNDPIDDLWRAG